MARIPLLKARCMLPPFHMAQSSSADAERDVNDCYGGSSSLIHPRYMSGMLWRSLRGWFCAMADTSRRKEGTRCFLSEDVANRQLEFELSLWLSRLIDQERNVGAIRMTKDPSVK